MKQFKQSLESALDIIGDIVPISIGMRNPVVLLEKAEQFLNKKSQQLEAFVEKKLQRQYQKEIFQEDIKKCSRYPSDHLKKQAPLNKGLSKEDVLKRLAEIDHIILNRELQQEFEHKRY